MYLLLVCEYWGQSDGVGIVKRQLENPGGTAGHRKYISSADAILASIASSNSITLVMATSQFLFYKFLLELMTNPTVLLYNNCINYIFITAMFIICISII